MKINTLIRAFNEGKLTAHDCALRVIVDVEVDAECVRRLPDEVKSALVQYVRAFSPGSMIILYGQSPTEQQVHNVRRVLEQLEGKKGS